MSDNQNNKPTAINWATVVLVVVTGGGNWLQTKTSNDFNAQEIQRATNEIHDLYPKLMEALRNQQTMLASDSKELQNQGLILENQRRILELLQKNHLP